MPAKKATAKKATAKKATAKKATAKKATAKKATAKKATAKKATAKKATAKKATAKKATANAAPRRPVSQPAMTPARRSPTPSGRTPMAKGRASRPLMPARPGDFIVIDSAQVGSLTREGEVLEVIQGKVSVSYRVKWADGHQSLIAPTSGSARIVPASRVGDRYGFLRRLL